MDASDGFVFPGTGNGTFERSPLRIGVTGEARDAFILEMPKGKKMMLVAQNNGPALLFNISAGK
jgi:hypothetical protein